MYSTNTSIESIMCWWMNFRTPTFANILLSANASVNTKPQLEIFADDVKCTHGCTVGRLNEEGLFYLQSRGIPEKIARNLLLGAYSADILEQIKLPAVRMHVEKLITQRLEKDLL